MVELVEAGGVGDVGEDDGRAVDKTTCRNRAVQRVLDRGVRRPGAHAALLTMSVGFREALRQPSGKQ